MKQLRTTSSYLYKGIHLLFIAAFAMGLAFSLGQVQPARAAADWYVDDDNCPGPGSGTPADPYCKIQDAIDAASDGDTINVAAGTYTPASMININKSVTLLGPQAGVDPRPSFASTRTAGSPAEAIIDGGLGGLGIILYIDADAVIIDGFEVKTGTGDMIRQSNAHVDTIVRYNIIHDGNGDEGAQLKQCTSCAVEYNYVFDIADPGDALSIAGGSVNSHINYNEIHDIGSENAAIYVYGSTNMEIKSNLVYTTTQNDGIKLGSKNGADAGVSGGSILDNIVHDTAQDGITVYMSDTLVKGNEVYNSSSENGAIYVAWGVSNVNITENVVRGNTLATGKWGDPGGIMIGTDVNAETVTVAFNRIFNNAPYGLTNHAATTLTARNNWWGCNYAPGSGGAGCVGASDSITGSVDATPWLVLGLDAAPPAIAAGGSSTLTADLTVNSDGVDTSAAGHLPDGIGVVFGVTSLGSVNPATTCTTSGKGTSTFTSNYAPGIATPSTTVDNQTVATSISVGAPDTPISGLKAENSSPTEEGNTTILMASVTAGTNIAYTWDFGDGATGSGMAMPHVYAAAGQYTATVTATNSVGWATDTTAVTINLPPAVDTPIAGLAAHNDGPTTLGDVTGLWATVTDGTGITYAWDFGDGTTGAGAVVTHTYGAAGTFTARVYATNSVSGAYIAITEVTVKAPAPAPVEYGLYLPIIEGTREYHGTH